MRIAMSKPKKLKPETVLAKADEAFTNDLRKVYPLYDEDAARFGRRVADFNAGFIKGDNQRKKKWK